MAASGRSCIQVVKERLGHGSITTTEGYLHSLPGADDAAMAALDVVRGNRAVSGLPQSPDALVAAMPQPRDDHGELAQMRGMLAEMKHSSRRTETTTTDRLEHHPYGDSHPSDLDETLPRDSCLGSAKFHAHADERLSGICG